MSSLEARTMITMLALGLNLALTLAVLANTTLLKSVNL